MGVDVRVVVIAADAAEVEGNGRLPMPLKLPLRIQCGQVEDAPDTHGNRHGDAGTKLWALDEAEEVQEKEEEEEGGKNVGEEGRAREVEREMGDSAADVPLGVHHGDGPQPHVGPHDPAPSFPRPFSFSSHIIPPALLSSYATTSPSSSASVGKNALPEASGGVRQEKSKNILVGLTSR